MSMSELHDVCHEVNDGLLQIRSGLMEFFSECGDIATVRIPTDRETGQIKGWAILVVICLGLEDDFSDGTSNPHILSSCLAA